MITVIPCRCFVFHCPLAFSSRKRKTIEIWTGYQWVFWEHLLGEMKKKKVTSRYPCSGMDFRFMAFLYCSVTSAFDVARSVAAHFIWRYP